MNIIFFFNLQKLNLLRFFSFGPGLSFKLMMTSVPKSGSHLLQAMLTNLRELKRAPVVLYPYKPVSEYRMAIEKLAHNRFAWGHIGLNMETLDLIQRFDMGIIVMLRDPRDIVVSFVDHVYRLKPHILKNYYTSLANDHARLKAAILGAQKEAYPRDQILAEQGIYDMYTGFTNIGRVCEGYLAWTEYSKTHVVHFEDLIGADGGGSKKNQEKAVRGVIDFLGLAYTESETSKICRKIYNPKSPTFNRGKTNRWKALFTEELKDIFKSVAGESLIEMGYEKDDSW